MPLTWTWMLAFEQSGIMTVTGYWFDADSSTRHAASLLVFGNRYELHINGERLRQGAGDELSVSDRLGNMPRRLHWPDDAVFETTDNASIDQWLTEVGHRSAAGLRIHQFERSWKWAGFGAVLAVLIGFATVRWGLPALSSSVADNLPASVHESISRQTLATLDRLFLDESKVNELEQADIRERFFAMADALPANEFTFKLHFRQMGEVPNAMALPGGDIIVTDALVDLVEHPDELDSVLLHEMGHVLERHGLQHAVRASAVSVVIALAFGDLSGVGEIAVGVPVFLLQSSYSRKLESEADAFAFDQMGKLGKDPRHFADMITRLGSEVPADQEDDEERGPAYFSSHPHTADRADKARQASRDLGFPSWGRTLAGT